MTAYTVNLDPIVKLTREQFYELCAANPELKLERNANGELVIMSPTGGETSAWNSDLNTDLNIWNRQERLGKVFDSSGGFSLPRGAIALLMRHGYPLKNGMPSLLNNARSFYHYALTLRSSFCHQRIHG